MGLRGKTPSSNAYKAIAGVRASRMGNQTELTGKPSKPLICGPIASAFWDTTISRLVELGGASDLDQESLEALAHWREVFELTRLALQGADYSTTATARLLNANKKAGDSYQTLAVHFGLTPLARNSVAFEEPTDADDGPFK